MAEFLAMGGHAFFVWTSYVLFVALLLFLHFEPGRRRRQLIRELKHRVSSSPTGKEEATPMENSA